MKKNNVFGKRKFPTLAVLLLVFGVVWLLSELGYFVVNVPWLPVVLIVVAIGWIYNRMADK